jgi:hypothetical protein
MRLAHQKAHGAPWALFRSRLFSARPLFHKRSLGRGIQLLVETTPEELLGAPPDVLLDLNQANSLGLIREEFRKK